MSKGPAAVPDYEMNKPIPYLAFSILAALSLASFAQAQSSNYVKARGLTSVDGIRPGDKFKVAIALIIDKGYHVNANKPNEKYLIPTTAEFELPHGISIAGIEYPAARLVKLEKVSSVELAVYEGTVYILAEAEAGKAIGQGAASIHARLTVQTCDDSQCFAPSDMEVEIPLQFVAAKQEVKETNADEFARAAAGLTDSGPSEAGEEATGAGVKHEGSDQPTNKIADLMKRRGFILALVGAVVAAALAIWMVLVRRR